MKARTSKSKNSSPAKERTTTTGGANRKSAGTSASSSGSDPTIPESAILEMRRAHNNAAARRGREKRRAAETGMRTQAKENEKEIRRLQDQVLVLETKLEKKRQEKGKKPSGKIIPGKGEFFEHRSFFGEPFWGLTVVADLLPYWSIGSWFMFRMALFLKQFHMA